MLNGLTNRTVRKRFSMPGGRLTPSRSRKGAVPNTNLLPGVGVWEWDGDDSRRAVKIPTSPVNDHECSMRA